MYLTLCNERDVCQKKRENVGIFLKGGAPPPPPCLGMTCVFLEKIMVYYAFLDIRNIFGFHIFFSLTNMGFPKWGEGEAGDLGKIPTFSRFFLADVP